MTTLFSGDKYPPDELPEEEAPPSLTDQLDAPLDESRVHSPPQGKFGDYLEGWDVIATANRIFGFDGWSTSIKPPETRESGFTTTIVTLDVVFPGGNTVHREDIGIGIPGGESAEAMETAIKGAVTDGLKRVFRTFGTQFGNSLYDKDRKNRAAGQAQATSKQPRPAPPAPAEELSGQAIHVGDLLTRGMKAASLQRNDVLAIVGKNNDGKSNHLDWIELHMPAAKHTPEEQVLGVLEMAHTKRFDMDLKGPKREAVLEALGE
jgi:DNA recombination protein Rad52